ncbi:MAG: BON domain-containing protein [Gemmatimonadaceae bacterium]|jgi:osmotically-inducible protein OsmY|nr:BON domain-containing protein [Gemmatimonadaceae bacterium]
MWSNRSRTEDRPYDQGRDREEQRRRYDQGGRYDMQGDTEDDRYGPDVRRRHSDEQGGGRRGGQDWMQGGGREHHDESSFAESGQRTRYSAGRGGEERDQSWAERAGANGPGWQAHQEGRDGYGQSMRGGYGGQHDDDQWSRGGGGGQRGQYEGERGGRRGGQGMFGGGDGGGMFGGQSGGQGMFGGGSQQGQFGGRGGQQGLHVGKGPRGWQRSDDRIRDEVNEALARHAEIDASEIDVEVNQGEITLSGTVSDRESKRLAEDVAEHVFGVQEVHNHLRIKRERNGAELQSSEGNRSGEQNASRRSMEGTDGNKGGRGRAASPTGNTAQGNATPGSTTVSSVGTSS